MSVAAHDSDVEGLHRMGYAQELRRRMSTFSNFAVSFTIISILSGCLTLYGYGMNTGGPIIMNIGWPLVGVMVLMVGLAMAEVCSSYPTAGGLYYWAAKLGGKNSAAWSWFTGWFNLLGQVGVTAGIDFGLALFADALFNALFNYPSTPIAIIGIYTVVLFLHGLLNTFGVGLVALLNDISVWWHLIGVALIFVVLLVVPAHHQSVSFIFTKFVNNTGFSGAPIYVFLIGLLLAQYTFTGYDASAHMTEETHNAALAGPRGIVWSIIVSLIAGWVLLIAVTGAIQDYTAEASSVTPGAQVFLDAAGHNMGLFLLFVIVGAQFYCGMSSVTANSRMIYAFSRDGAVPGSQLWHKINPRTRTPTNSIIFATVGGCDVDRGHRPVHRVRHADPPPPPGGRQVPARAVAPRALELRGRVDRGDLDRLHRHPLRAPAGLPRHDADDVQLRHRGGRRSLALLRWLLVPIGTKLVQGTQGPGLRRRARPDRAGAGGRRQHELTGRAWATTDRG